MVNCIIAVGCLPPLEACMTTSGTIKASPQEEIIHVSSHSEVSGALFLRCTVSSAKWIHLTSLSIIKGNRNTLYILGVSSTALVNNSKEDFLCLVWGLSLSDLWLLGGMPSTQKSLLKLYMCEYKLSYVSYKFLFRQTVYDIIIHGFFRHPYF